MKRPPLKRKTQLKSKTQLQPGLRGLKRSPLKRQRKSKKERLEAAWRSAVKQRDNHCCQLRGFGAHTLAVHAHHIATRKQRPDLIYEVSNGVTLCSEHHAFVHDNPRTARELGLLSGERYELARQARPESPPSSDD